jgi:hypothetical protein
VNSCFFLTDINDEENLWQCPHVANAAEASVELIDLSGEAKRFLFCEYFKLASITPSLQVIQFVNA